MDFSFGDIGWGRSCGGAILWHVVLDMVDEVVFAVTFARLPAWQHKNVVSKYRDSLLTLQMVRVRRCAVAQRLRQS